MKVKNSLILSLAQTSVLDIDYTRIPAKHAYKVFKFKRELGKAYKELEEQRSQIIKNALGDDYDKVAEYESARQSGDSKKTVLNETSYKKLIEEMFVKAGPMLEELYNEEVDLPLATIPFETYFVLKVENKDICTDRVDQLLAGILFDDGENKEYNGNTTEKEKTD